MITSSANKRVAAAVRLKKRALRDTDRRFLVEGTRAVREALDCGAGVSAIFYLDSRSTPDPAVHAARRRGVPAFSVSPEVMGVLTSTVTPQGVVAVVDFVDLPLRDISPDARLVPVLVRVRDPGNAGTILRSADAAGADAVVFTGSSVDLYNPKTVRATAGSLFHLPVVRDAELGAVVEGLRGRGLAIVAASATAPTTVHQADLGRPTAVLFGNEAHGLADDALGLADQAVRVPIRRAESLNLAAAATVFLFESARQRAGGTPLGRVVSGAAHDIRSPLAAIRGFGSTLLRMWDRLGDEQRLSMVEGIASDAVRMGTIVTQLVDAARLESGTMELSLGEVDLLDVVRSFADQARQPGAPDMRFSGEPVLVTADVERLRSILAAMVEAATWWGQDGPVVVDVRALPDPRIRVRRERATLEREAASELFGPRPEGIGQGSKVGLFVARGLAEAHGGRLDVEVDGGVSFELRLPGKGSSLDSQPP